MRTKWRNYGQWRHPELWWESYLHNYLKETKSELLKLEPKVIEVRNHEIVFTIDTSSIVFVLKKCILVNQLNSELN